MGLSLLILGLRLGAPGVHFNVFLWLWGQTLDLFFDVSGKGSKITQRKKKKEAEMDKLSMEVRVFPENAKVRFDCTGASELRPLLFKFFPSIFRVSLLHCFFLVFVGPSLGARPDESAAEAGPP